MPRKPSSPVPTGCILKFVPCQGLFRKTTSSHASRIWKRIRQSSKTYPGGRRGCYCGKGTCSVRCHLPAAQVTGAAAASTIRRDPRFPWRAAACSSSSSPSTSTLPARAPGPRPPSPPPPRRRRRNRAPPTPRSYPSPTLSQSWLCR
jgi:hypothetical protein